MGHQLTVGRWVVGTAGGTAGGSVELSVTVNPHHVSYITKTRLFWLHFVAKNMGQLQSL